MVIMTVIIDASTNRTPVYHSPDKEAGHVIVQVQSLQIVATKIHGSSIS